MAKSTLGLHDGAVWLILFAVALLVALNWAFISWRYVLDERPQRIDVQTADGWTVVAWHRPAVEKRFPVPVVLCHGLANNHAFMDFRGEQNLAKYLCAAGFDCYSVDLRGAGSSVPPHEGPWDANFDDHVKWDLPALVDAVCAHAKVEHVVWVGHSLGGLMGLVAATTVLKDKFSALVTIGSPVFFKLPPAFGRLVKLARGLSPWGQFNVGFVRFIAPIAGRFVLPAATHVSANLRNLESRSQRYLAANVFAPLWKGVLGQLDDWLQNDAFRSADKKDDYRAGLGTITVPTLMIAGSSDLLAPPSMAQEAFTLIQAPVRQLELVGKSYGHSVEYGHGDLIVGEQAHLEVYPVIRRFLEANVK